VIPYDSDLSSALKVCINDNMHYTSTYTLLYLWLSDDECSRLFRGGAAVIGDHLVVSSSRQVSTWGNVTQSTRVTPAHETFRPPGDTRKYSACKFTQLNSTQPEITDAGVNISMSASLCSRSFKLNQLMTTPDRFPVPVRSAVKSNLTNWRCGRICRDQIR